MSSSKVGSAQSASSQQLVSVIAHDVVTSQAQAAKSLRAVRADAAARQRQVNEDSAARLTKVSDNFDAAKKPYDYLLGRVTSALNVAKSRGAPDEIWTDAERGASGSSGAGRQLNTLADEAQAIQGRFDNALTAFNRIGGSLHQRGSKRLNLVIIGNLLVVPGTFVLGLDVIQQSLGGREFSAILAYLAELFPLATDAPLYAPLIFGRNYALAITIVGILLAVHLAIAVGLLLRQVWTPFVVGGYVVVFFLAAIFTLNQFLNEWFLIYAPSIIFALFMIGFLFAKRVRPVWLGALRRQASASRLRGEAAALVGVDSAAQQAYTQALAKLTAIHDAQRMAAGATNDAEMTRVNTECATLLATAEKTYEDGVASRRETLARASANIPLNTAALSETQWDRWRQATHSPVSLPFMRLGALTADPSASGDLPTPLLAATATPASAIPLTLERGLLIEAPAAAKPRAVAAIQALLFRLLAALPPGQALFTFIDPVGLGANVAGFMPLAEYDRRLVDGKAWVEPQHIEDRLLALTEHVEATIQKNLRNDYADVEDYNARNEIKLPYHIVVILDFPKSLRDDALRRVMSLATQGARCGVYPIILRDADDLTQLREFNLDSLRQACIHIAYNGSRFVWDDPGLRDYTLTLDTAPDDALLKRVIETVGPVAATADQVEYTFDKIAPAESKWWTTSADAGLDVTLGPAEGAKMLALHMDEEDHVSGLIVGQPGSGKSSLLHTLLTNLALNYDPDDVRLYLVDMKQGVEFEAFARARLPHARVVAIGSDREFGLSVLKEVAAELERRGELFRKSSIQNLSQYRRGGQPGGPMPRMLVAIDEFHSLFDEDDDIATQSGAILDHLARQGRSYGIHVLLATQTLDGQRRLSRATKDLIQVRIVLKSSDTDSRMALAEDNGAARLLSRPGEAIYNDSSGRIDANRQFQVAYLERSKQTTYLSQLRQLAVEKHKPEYPQIIFDGNQSVAMDDGAAREQLVGNWPASPYPLRAWLGEPVEIRPSVAGVLRRQSGANLLVMSQRSAMALGLVTAALVGLATQIRPAMVSYDPIAQFYVADLSPADNSAASDLERVRAALPHDMRIIRSRMLAETVQALAGEVDRRLALRDTPQDATLAPIILTVFGLQSARDLRPDDQFGGGGGGFGGGWGSGQGDSPPPPISPAQAFQKVLRDGPETGIHTIVWCDTVTNFDRSVQRGGMREFALRALFRASREDSQNVINSAAAETLNPYRALLLDDDTNTLTKFRPYAVPTDAWLTEVSARLRARG